MKMRKIYLIATTLIALALTVGCSKIDNTKLENHDIPPMVTGATAAGYNGGIMVSWTNPEEGEFSYVKLDFANPLTGKHQTVRVKYPETSWTIDQVAPADGAMSFLLTTVSSAGVHSATSTTVTATAILPANVSGLTATPVSGGVITLDWVNPDDDRIERIEISYTDPRDENETKGETVTETIAYPVPGDILNPGNTIDITGLLNRYGEMTFTVVTVGVTGLKSEGVSVTATPLRVEKQFVKIPLTVDMLSSNASDPSEGNLATLLDENLGTFWHSNWHSTVPFPNYIQVSLPQGVTEMKFKTTNRNRAAYGVKTAEILLGDDEDDFTKVGDITDGTVSDAASAVYESPSYKLADNGTFGLFRYNVLSAYGGTGNVDAEFWCLAEFEVYKVWGDD